MSPAELEAALALTPLPIRRLLYWALLLPVILFGLVGFVLGFAWLGLREGARHSRNVMDGVRDWANPYPPAGAYALSADQSRGADDGAIDATEGTPL